MSANFAGGRVASLAGAFSAAVSGAGAGLAVAVPAAVRARVEALPRWRRRVGLEPAPDTGATSGRTTPVVAVADPRTYSIVVSASKDQMPDIAEMVARLDYSSARKQKAFIITVQNADVQQVQAVLQNLFQSSVSRTSSTTQADPLSYARDNKRPADQLRPCSHSGQRFVGEPLTLDPGSGGPPCTIPIRIIFASRPRDNGRFENTIQNLFI